MDVPERMAGGGFWLNRGAMGKIHRTWSNDPPDCWRSGLFKMKKRRPLTGSTDSASISGAGDQCMAVYAQLPR